MIYRNCKGIPLDNDKWLLEYKNVKEVKIITYNNDIRNIVDEFIKKVDSKYEI